MNHIEEPELISVSPAIKIKDDGLSQTFDFLCSPDWCEPDTKCMPNSSCAPDECSPRDVCTDPSTGIWSRLPQSQ